MRRTVSSSPTALTLRRLRARFGIAAPQVSVRTHLPWHWRVLSRVALLAVGFALGIALYEAYLAWLSPSLNLRAGVSNEQLENMQEELSSLRSSSGSADSVIQIERTAKEELSKQVKTLQAENARLKEDLALFQGLASSGAQDGAVNINRFQVESDGSSVLNYRMLVTVGGQKDRSFSGSLQLVVSGMQQGRSVMLTYPSATDARRSAYGLDFRHFQRMEGQLQLPADVVAKSVEARVLQGGQVCARMSASL